MWIINSVSTADFVCSFSNLLWCIINKYSGNGYHIDAKHFNCIILTSCFRADSFCYIFPSASKTLEKSCTRAMFCFHKLRTIYDRKLLFFFLYLELRIVWQSFCNNIMYVTCRQLEWRIVPNLMFMLPSLPFRNKLEAPRRKVAILKIVVSLNIKPEKNVVQQDVIY